MKHRSLLALAAGTVATALLAPMAHAATTADTQATFTLTGGFLSISAPAGPVDLGAAGTSLLAGVQASGSLGATTVTDDRNSLTGWDVSASSTDFVEQGVGATGNVDAANVQISIPAASVVANATNLGGGTLFTPTAGTTGDVGGAIGQTPLTLNGLLGVLNTTNTVTYEPDVTVSVPADTPDGTYLGTITQTVAAL